MNIHGGRWYEFKTEYGTEPLDFSSSMNPLGMPKSVAEAAEKAVSLSSRYPDPECTELTEAIAQKLGVSADSILCGAGAADLIYRIAGAVAPKCALITAPTFSEYASALSLRQCEIREYLLSEDNDFLLNDDFAEKITPDVNLVILCEPNNPTGRCSDINLLLKIIEKCRASDAYLLVDESFIELTDNPDEHTLLRKLNYDKLIILRAFTKQYAMAGLRLGYCLCGNNALLEKIRNYGPPWNVSIPAQNAGIAALKEDRYLSETRKLISSQRKYMTAELSGIGLKVYPSDCNFILFRTEQDNLDELLEKHGILIRNCGSFSGLDSHYYRISIRMENENLCLLNALREVVG